jgi:hypothetical protein
VIGQVDVREADEGNDYQEEAHNPEHTYDYTVDKPTSHDRHRHRRLFTNGPDYRLDVVGYLVGPVVSGCRLPRTTGSGHGFSA